MKEAAITYFMMQNSLSLQNMYLPIFDNEYYDYSLNRHIIKEQTKQLARLSFCPYILIDLIGSEQTKIENPNYITNSN